MSAMTRHVNALFDLLCQRSATRSAIAEHLGISERYVDQVMNSLRHTLGRDGEANVITIPQGYGFQHLYELRDDYEGSEEWFSRNLHHCKSHLQTLSSVSRSIVRHVGENRYARYEAEATELGVSQAGKHLGLLIGHIESRPS